MWLFGSSNQTRGSGVVPPSSPSTTTSTAVSFSPTAQSIGASTSAPSTNLAESVSVGWELLLDKTLDKQEQLKRLADELETSSFTLPEESEKTLASLLLISCKSPTLLANAKECLKKALLKSSPKGLQNLCEQFCNDYADTQQLEAMVALLEVLPPLETLQADDVNFRIVSIACDTIIPTLFSRTTASNIPVIIQLIGKLITRYSAVNRLPNLKKIQIYKEYLSTGILLGQGSFAKVYLSFHKKTAEKYAIKVMNYQRLFQRNSATAVQVKNEIDVMTETAHPNIVRLVDKFMIGDHVYLILEYCDGGSLDSLIKKNGPLSEERTKKIMQELAEAFRFLRSKDYVHRDMKPANILLATDPQTKQFSVKITDFTFARTMELGDTADTFCGTPLYMAPEVLARGPYTDKADLWSLGVIMYEMLTGKRPFETHKLIASTTRGPEELVLEFPKEIIISKDARNLLSSFLQADPNKRISWAEFFWHPFVKPPPPPKVKSSVTLSGSASPVSSSLEHLQLRAEAAEKKVTELQQKLQETEGRLIESEKRQNQSAEGWKQKEEAFKQLENANLGNDEKLKENNEKLKEADDKLKETDDKLKQAKEKEVELMQKNSELEEELQARGNESEMTKTELQEMRKQNEKMSHTIAEQTAEVVTLRKELAETTQQTEKATQSNTQQKEEIRKEMEELTNQNKKILADVEQKEELVVGLRTELEEVKKRSEKSNAEHKEELETLRKQLEETQNQNTQALQSNAEQKAELVALKQELEATRKQNVVMSQTNAEQKEELIALKKELEETKKQSAIFSTGQKEEVSALQKELGEYQESVRELKTRKDQEVSALQKEIEEHKLQRDMLEKKAVVAQEGLSTLKKSLVEVVKKQTEKQEDLEKKTQLVASLTLNRDEAVVLNRQLQQQLLEKQEEIRGLVAEIEKRKGEVEGMKKHVESATNSLKEEQKRLQSSNSLLAQSSAELGQMKLAQEQVKILNDEVKKRDDKINELKAIHANCVAEVQSLRESRQDADIRAQEFQMLLDSNENEIKSWKDRIEDLVARNQELEQLRREQAQEIEKANKIALDLRKELEAVTTECVKKQEEIQTLLLLLKEENELAESTIIPFTIQDNNRRG